MNPKRIPYVPPEDISDRLEEFTESYDHEYVATDHHFYCRFCHDFTVIRDHVEQELETIRTCQHSAMVTYDEQLGEFKVLFNINGSHTDDAGKDG